MDKDIFGNKIEKKKRKSRLESGLAKYDKSTFTSRLDRLKYINKIFPDGIIIAADMETFFIFDEAKMAFINGEYISTILLAQSFIEKIFQDHYCSIGLEKESKRGLKYLIKHAKKNDIIHEFLLDKIELLRKKRNPFTHLKPYNHKFTINNRFYDNFKKYEDIHKMLENDAKEAMSLMYTISISNLRNAT